MNYTREQLEQMSDFEINKALANKIGWEVADICDKSSLGMTTNFHQRYPNTIWALKRAGDAWEQICFTGSDGWNDIMPLAVEYDVTYIKHYKTAYSKLNGDRYDKMFTSESPQRAMACCLLMMELKP